MHKIIFTEQKFLVGSTATPTRYKTETKTDKNKNYAVLQP